MVDDFSFTKQDLVDGILIVPDTRIVEFSIEDNNGDLVVPSRYYQEYSGETQVDFSGWNIEGTWWVRKISVIPGKDAEPGIELNEYMVNMYLLKSDGKYIIDIGEKPSFPIEQTKTAPVLGSQFYAAEKSQLVSGEIIPAILPAFGEMRQYVWTSAISSGEEGLLYQFQVFRNDLIVFDYIQDSLTFAQNSRFRGNAFYFPENLPSETEGKVKYNYYWRVRASYKLKDESGNLYWSGWSKTFPFTVNTPPGAPFDLYVKIPEEVI